MFEDRQATARFLSAPLSTSAAFSALLEPFLAVALLWLAHLVFDEPVEGDSIALLLLVAVMLYPGVNRLGRTGVGVGIDILLGWVPLLAVLAVIGWATRPYHDLPMEMLLVWAGATPLALWICTRAATAVLNRRLAHPEAQRRAVVVGAGQMGQRVKEVIASRKKSGWRMLGLFDDRAPERLNLAPDPEFLGKLADLPAFIDAHGVNDVFITLPLSSQPRILALMEALENSTASVHYVPDLFGVSIIQGRLDDMGGLPVVSLMLSPFTGVNRLIKRASDIVLASAILLLVAPIMLAVAVGVRLSSPGPIIFKQRRTGLDGEAIWVYKFRSMTTLDDG
ncbi:MAG: sugar transferase, partial [Burkholderiaceae bacterium]|nr:sugar transferase [Burkholderiaceae bacterium]